MRGKVKLNGRTQVKLWYNQFKEGPEYVNDDGRPSTLTTDENIEAVKKMILDNRRITIGELADDVGISLGSCQAIFTDVLGMERAAAKIVINLLNFERKHRMDGHCSRDVDDVHRLYRFA